MDFLLKTDGKIDVKMDSTEGGAVTRAYSYEINNFARLGKEIKITPKSHVIVSKNGYKAEFFTETVSVVIGIGNDHCADLIMSKSAWEALNSGEKINIITTEDFKKKYVYRTHKNKKNV